MYLSFCHLTLIEYLLQNSADPNIQTKDKDTPLHYAVKLGRHDLAKLYVAHGASLEIVGFFLLFSCLIITRSAGQIPPVLAKSLGQKRVADTLRDSIELIRWMKSNQFDSYIPLFLEEGFYLIYF